MSASQLQTGSTGDEVRDLQEILLALGYDIGAADGAFGPSTERAVVAIQSSAGITADGIVGPSTWQAIDEADRSEPTLEAGASGPSVRRAQSVLARHGYDVGAVDGTFGPDTAAGVKALQRGTGLTEDGIVGASTWAQIGALDG